MIVSLALALFLGLQTLIDPVGDAAGDGTLGLPSAAIYGTGAALDLQQVTLLDAARLTLDVRLGALPNPLGLPNGFSHPIIEIYLDTEEGGAAELLPGSGLAMPAGRGWEIALRVDGDRALAYQADAGGVFDPALAAPVTVATVEGALRVQTPYERPDDATVYAVVGLYDAFAESGWRALTADPSAWSYSSETQSRPVVDLLAPDLAVQERVIGSGRLSEPDRRGSGLTAWPWVMGLGLALALAGVLLRARSDAPVADPAGLRLDDEAASEVPAGDESAGVDPAVERSRESEPGPDQASPAGDFPPPPGLTFPSRLDPADADAGFSDAADLDATSKDPFAPGFAGDGIELFTAASPGPHRVADALPALPTDGAHAEGAQAAVAAPHQTSTIRWHEDLPGAVEVDDADPTPAGASRQDVAPSREAHRMATRPDGGREAATPLDAPDDDATG